MPSTFSLSHGTFFLGALVTEFLILAHAQRVGTALHVMDHPDQIRKQHPHVTPLVGGLAIMAPLLIWTATKLILGQGANDRFELVILLCGAGATLLGHTDDQSSTSPSSRLLSLFLLTAIALVIAPQLLPPRLIMSASSSLLLAPWMAYGLITIAMAGFVNAVNMADGQNGIVTGMFCIWSACLIVVTQEFAKDLASVLFVASFLAFLFNIWGRVFLGDAGTYGVTFVFGLLAIHAHNTWRVSAATITVWFFIPVVDCVRLMVTRVLSGRAPSDGDRNHFHHRLQSRVGLRNGLIIYLSAVGTPSLAAAFFPQLSILCLLVLVALYVSLAWIDSEQVLKLADLPPGNRDREFRTATNNSLALVKTRERNAEAS